MPEPPGSDLICATACESMMSHNASSADVTGTDLTDRVYTRLLALLSNRIWTGAEVLSDVALAQGLGVSRTPVRLALARLTSEGLVRKTPGKSWAPVPLTLKDIQDIFAIKEALEALTVRQAAERTRPETAQELRALLGKMGEAAAAGDLQLWIEADDLFHYVLLKMVDNERLSHCMGLLDSQWYRFRMGYLSQERDLGTLCEEHRQIAEAVIAGDGDRAVHAVRLHLRHVRDRICQIMRDVLIPFLGIADAPGAGHPEGDL